MCYETLALLTEQHSLPTGLGLSQHKGKNLTCRYSKLNGLNQHFCAESKESTLSFLIRMKNFILKFINVFSSLCAYNFIFLLNSSLMIYSALSILFCLIPVVTSYIHEFRGLPFLLLLLLLLPGGHHSNFLSSLCSSILRT